MQSLEQQHEQPILEQLIARIALIEKTHGKEIAARDALLASRDVQIKLLTEHGSRCRTPDMRISGLDALVAQE